MKAVENRAGTCAGQHQGAAMNKGKKESHAETRSSRRESNPPTSALSAAPREKKSGDGVRKRGLGTIFDYGSTSSLCSELAQVLRSLNGLLPKI